MRAAFSPAFVLWFTALVGLATASEAPSGPAAHRHETVAPAQAIAGESLYQLDLQLTTADGRTRRLADLAGRPALITMFYASCDGVCPLLAFHLQRLERALSASERARLQVVMVSFDPARDTPAALARFAALHRLDARRWWLARASEGDVRELAAVLGIRYRETTRGVFNHSAVITLLDAQGVIVERSAKLEQVDAQFQARLRDTLAH